MAFSDWWQNARKYVDEDGLRTGGRKAAGEFYLGLFRQAGKRLNYGRRIYDYEWDMLLVLDACRADLMAEIVNEYDYLTDEAAFSCASSSGEWHRKNFSDTYAEQKSETALVSANPYTDMHTDAEDFLILEEVWRDAFDREIRTIPADKVVDRAITTYREYTSARLIVHFMQPHYPFVRNPLDEGLAIHDYDHTPWDTVWDQVRKGTLSRDVAWTGYRDNLRYVLDHVSILLQNVNADKVIITADHGNLLGEFGFYGHPQYVPIPALKRVPWVVTSARDTGSYTPETTLATDVSLDEQLAALGYK